jgi:LPS export ABC transporter protein LptC
MIRVRKWPPARSRRQKWLALLGLVALLGAGAWAVFGRRPPPPPAPKAASGEQAAARMETVAMTEIQEGGKRWVLEGLKADYHKDRLEIEITEVKVVFYGESGEPIHVKAREGFFNTKTRVMTLRGDVVMDRGDLHVTTSLAVYNPEEKLLVAPEEVVMETPRIKVMGKDLRVKTAEKKLVLAQHHSTEIKSQPARTTQ